MLTLLYEFPPLCRELPAFCVPMFNAPPRWTLPSPLAWQPKSWQPGRDFAAAVEHLRPIVPEHRAIVFPWACHLNFPPLPQKETLSEWGEEVYRRATHALHHEEDTWAREYFYPFLTALKREFPQDPGPTLIFDNETGFKIEHIYNRFRHEKDLTPAQRHEGATAMYEGMLKRLAEERQTTPEEIKKQLGREPVATLRRQCKGMADVLWEGNVQVNFGDNGTDRTRAANGWTLSPHSGINENISCPVFYLSDDKLLAKCLDFAAEAFRNSDKSLPLLCLLGMADQPESVLRQLAKGLHDIGYRKVWMFNGYSQAILRDPHKVAEHAKQELETARIVEAAIKGGQK